MRPLAIDLFCGLGGWTEGFLANSYRVVGFDIEVRPYPAQLVIQDVLTIHGSQFKDAACIVASPPCQAYSYRAMPWKRAKALPPPDNSLFEACFRIQREACEAAGHHIPMVVENVRGAQKWVGRAPWNYGSFYLWGDVPALMPIRLGRGGKVPGFNFHEHAKTGKPGRSFESAAVDGLKVPFADGRRTDIGKGARFTSLDCGVEGTKQGGNWWNKEARAKGAMSNFGSKSPQRKLASAQIAKIPFPLSDWIARCFKPEFSEAAR